MVPPFQSNLFAVVKPINDQRGKKLLLKIFRWKQLSSILNDIRYILVVLTLVQNADVSDVYLKFVLVYFCVNMIPFMRLMLTKCLSLFTFAFIYSYRVENDYVIEKGVPTIIHFLYCTDKHFYCSSLLLQPLLRYSHKTPG